MLSIIRNNSEAILLNKSISDLSLRVQGCMFINALLFVTSCIITLSTTMLLWLSKVVSLRCPQQYYSSCQKLYYYAAYNNITLVVKSCIIMLPTTILLWLSIFIIITLPTMILLWLSKVVLLCCLQQYYSGCHKLYHYAVHNNITQVVKICIITLSSTTLQLKIMWLGWWGG